MSSKIHEKKNQEKENQDKEYTCCRGLLFYGGLQRSLGQEPRCLGYKSLLPDIKVTEEDVVPPPPEKAKFIFISVGISVYNKEMLSRNQLPLVNGISQVIISEEIMSGGDLSRRDGGRHRSDGREQHERPPEYPEGVMAKDDLATDAFPRAQQRRHVIVDADVERERGSLPRRRKYNPEEMEEIKAKDREEARREAQQKIEALLTTAHNRVHRHYKISVDLARATPGKIPQAANLQASKAQEMPGMMATTAKKGLDLSALAVRSLTNQLSDDKDKKK